MRLCVYEDQRALDFGPLSLTRPVFDLLSGFGPLDSLHRRYFCPSATGYLVRPELANMARYRRPNAPINDVSWLRAATTILSNSRWFPPQETGPFAIPAEPAIAVCQDEIAYAVLTPDYLASVAPQTLGDCLTDWFTHLPLEGGRRVRRTFHERVAGPQFPADCH